MQARTLPHISFRRDGLAIVSKQDGPATIASDWNFAAARLFARGHNFSRLPQKAVKLQYLMLERYGFRSSSRLIKVLTYMLENMPEDQAQWVRSISDLHDMPVVELAYFIYFELRQSGGDFTPLQNMFALDENARDACVRLYRMVAIEVALAKLIDTPE